MGRWLIAPWLNRIARSMNRLTFEQLDLRPNESFLEVGFGGGELLGWSLSVTDGEVSGVDVSEAMVARAQRKFRRETKSGRLRLYRSSAEALPLPDASVAKACSVASIYFWPDPGAAMRELARVVRPGGKLVLCFEPPEELRKWPGHRYGFRIYQSADVAGMMTGAGFGPISVAYGTGRKPDHFVCLSAERRAENGGV